MCRFVPRAEATPIDGERYLVVLQCPGWTKPQVMAAEYHEMPRSMWLIDCFGWQPDEYVIEVADFPTVEDLPNAARRWPPNYRTKSGGNHAD